MLTALDQVANRNHLQLLKAVIPYIQSRNQKTISVCIKLMELQNILNFYEHSDSFVSGCSTQSDPPDFLDMLADLRNYCDDGEQEMIDQCIQLISTLELYSMLS